MIGAVRLPPVPPMAGATEVGALASKADEEDLQATKKKGGKAIKPAGGEVTQKKRGRPPRKQHK